jgi:hypothetical protein
MTIIVTLYTAILALGVYQEWHGNDSMAQES